MNEGVMVIPLRVPREVGREWKVAAAKQDMSVQKWILGRLNITSPSNTPKTPVSGELRAEGTDGDAQRGGSIPQAKTVKSVLITGSESKPSAHSPRVRSSTPVVKQVKLVEHSEPVLKAMKSITEHFTPYTSTLKEDHGWCKGCGVNQVRLPAMLCKECSKEAGEDL